MIPVKDWKAPQWAFVLLTPIILLVVGVYIYGYATNAPWLSSPTTSKSREGLTQDRKDACMAGLQDQLESVVRGPISVHERYGAIVIVSAECTDEMASEVAGKMKAHPKAYDSAASCGIVAIQCGDFGNRFDF